MTASHIVPSPKSLIGAKTAIIHHTHTTVDEMVISKDVAYSFSIGHQAKVHFSPKRKTTHAHGHRQNFKRNITTNSAARTVD